MSEADKMFEDLGYGKQQVCNPLTGEEYSHDYEYAKWDGTWEEHILINDSTKLIHISNLLFGKETGIILTKKKLQAINKKCKELGWLDE